MRKGLLISFVLLSISSYAQLPISLPQDTSGLFQNINKVSKKYIGVDLATPFQELVDQVFKDPEITIDTTISRSDSTVFYLRGNHKTFNPFHIKLDSVRLIIAEVKRLDSKTKNIRDTAFYLQTEGIVVGENEFQNIRKRFRALDKELRHSFSKPYRSTTKNKKEVLGEGIEYYSAGPMPVLNITCGKKNNNTSVIVITVKAFLQKPSDRM